jgi:hypothetical protein
MRIFKNQPAELNDHSNPSHCALSLSPARVPRIPPAPHLGRTLARLPNAAIGHRPGIPRTPRSRCPVRLAITAVPENAPTPEKPGKTPQNPSQFSLTIFWIFPKSLPLFFLLSS